MGRLRLSGTDLGPSTWGQWRIATFEEARAATSLRSAIEPSLTRVEALVDFVDELRTEFKHIPVPGKHVLGTLPAAEKLRETNSTQ